MADRRQFALGQCKNLALQLDAFGHLVERRAFANFDVICHLICFKSTKCGRERRKLALNFAARICYYSNGLPTASSIPTQVPMTDRSDPEIKGNFLSHPFAELLAEIAAARLNG